MKMIKLLFDIEIQNVVIAQQALSKNCWFHFVGKSLLLVGCVLQK